MQNRESRIRELDRRMGELIRERAELVRETAAAADGEGSFPDWREVDRLETEGRRIVYQGVEGAYSHQALRQFFGRDAQAFAVPTFESAISAVTSGLADYGVLPIENTTGGSVGDVLDLIVKYDCTTVAELDLPIRHVLLGLPGAELSGIRTVYSHPQGLLQCADFLEGHPDWSRVPLGNTAASARRVAEEGDPSQAAIASELCGELYGLDILASGIASNPDNTTRFIIITREKIYRRDAGKIRLCLECRHETGALYRLLTHITLHGINMTKIESRPLPGRNFEYRFFVECEGSLGEAGMRDAIRGMRADAGLCRIMGNY